MIETSFAYRNQDEFRTIRRAEATGCAFVLMRDADGALVVAVLDDPERVAIVGRQEGCDVHIGWDHRVSRIHATVEFAASDWWIVDAGRSLNGTYVNGERVTRRLRLHDRDLVRVGDVDLLFRRPLSATSAATLDVVDDPRVAALVSSLTARERAIMASLGAPLDPVTGGQPATNSRIAEQLGTEVPNIKAALTVLFQKFGLSGVEPSEKRLRLAELALRYGLTTPSDPVP